MRDMNEHFRLTCTDHVRVPSPMIGQYKLDLWVNSIHDTGTVLFTTLMANEAIEINH